MGQSRSRWPAVVVFAVGMPLAATLLVFLLTHPDYRVSRSDRPALLVALAYGWFLAVGLALRVYSYRKLSGPLTTWWVFIIASPIVTLLWATGLDERAIPKITAVALFVIVGVLVGVVSHRLAWQTSRRLVYSSSVSRRYFVQDHKPDFELALRHALREFETAPERFHELAPRVAHLYASTGKAEEAVKLIDEFVARGPSAESYSARAGVLQTLDRKSEALVDLGKAIKLSAHGKPLHDALIRRALLALETPDLDLALSDINRCIREFGESSAHYSIRALIHEAKHNPVAATLDTKKAREITMKAIG